MSDVAGELRFVRESDAAALCAVYNPYVLETRASFETAPVTEEAMRERIRAAAVTYPFLVYVPESTASGGSGAGAPVAYACASRHREREAYRYDVDVSIYIDPRYHRAGIGRGLYAALFALLRRQGYYSVYAGITLPNAGSVGLHEAFGFRRVGLHPNTGYQLDAWCDVAWYHLPLREASGAPGALVPVTELDEAARAAGLSAGMAALQGRPA